MTEPQSTGNHDTLASRLGARRFLTGATLLVERAWPLVLPLLITISLFASLSWLGVFRIVPEWARLVLLGFAALALLGSLYPLRYLRLPARTEIDRRIESANALEHTPVLVQHDRLTGNEDSFSQALWQEHRRRMADKLKGLGGDLPRAGMPERDPWGLRSAVALLLVAAFAFSFGPMGGDLRDGFRAHSGAEAVPPRIDAWITPPAYTGKAPIFLAANIEPNPAPIVVPEGSDLALRITGGPGNETLTFTDMAEKSAEIPPMAAAADTPAPAGSPSAAPRQFTGKLDTDGTLALATDGETLASWHFAVTPDKAPAIRFAGEPRQAANGTLELSYVIEDDYGAATAKSDFKLTDAQKPGARPLYTAPEMPLALPRGNNRDKPARSTRDLTEHVWAGVPVDLTLLATDDAGQEARSETKTFILPEKQFLNPLARAVIEQRRMLGLDANAKPEVMGLIDAITLRPEDTFDNTANYLAIMSARSRLNMAKSEDELRGVVDYFWEIALGIEQGSLSDAERRLQAAQKALQEALENGASDEEIEQRMAELRQAMDEFLREFAQRSQQNQNQAQMPENMQTLRQSDLDKMMDQIENLAKSGNRDKAQELLSQLQDMMNNLQMARPQQGQQGQQNSEMRQQMDKLGEIMRRQQEMMNETHRMDQMQRGQQGDQGEQQPGQQGQQGQGRPMTPEEFADAMRQLQEGQGQLQQDLQGLQKGLEGLGIQPGEGFGQAGEAMGEAEGSLGRGEGENAVGEQGRALEALRQGAQDMMQQLQAMQGDEGGGQEGGRQQSSDRDPLGRPRATTGPDFGDSVIVPDEIDVQRARQILEAIRKRLGNALSPDLERSYLERLLQLQ
ncbi:TIGR02302 family protein [Oryzicola mucosus]|uniref:TIGR02302 family protein n=1 Tax=Oryzicola mucosus TaxID=2767425 RepID=A0A8J6U9H6_9HYPH|nr:TIGR02302 family protein [Oryzicola mucosus]MBD0417282.1 TIGR02302 family protein [Oryzicola mucosus]